MKTMERKLPISIRSDIAWQKCAEAVIAKRGPLEKSRRNWKGFTAFRTPCAVSGVRSALTFSTIREITATCTRTNRPLVANVRRRLRAARGPPSSVPITTPSSLVGVSSASAAPAPALSPGKRSPMAVMTACADAALTAAREVVANMVLAVGRKVSMARKPRLQNAHSIMIVLTPVESAMAEHKGEVKKAVEPMMAMDRDSRRAMEAVSPL
mmetsp:Transcript_65953/g.175652  ORF Transcript_65953/g.175652 Transcript_65953/m.175652 type:complete len:211 (+) Transcript_65953:236-868(+)